MRSLVILALTLAWTAPAAAQTTLRREAGELFVSLAWAHLFRAEDRTFGDRPDIGAGLRLPLARRVGVELEVNRALGLHADAAPCGLVGGCEGTAREGFLDATLASANVYVRFGRGRVEPFLVGGAGGLWTKSVSSVTTVRNAAGVMSEIENRDVGLAIGVGAGLDVAVTPSFSVRPEVRIYDSAAMSRVNLAIIRTSIAAGWRW
jgi:opacity protein-like surface antigen